MQASTSQSQEVIEIERESERAIHEALEDIDAGKLFKLEDMEPLIDAIGNMRRSLRLHRLIDHQRGERSLTDTFEVGSEWVVLTKVKVENEDSGRIELTHMYGRVGVDTMGDGVHRRSALRDHCGGGVVVEQSRNARFSANRSMTGWEGEWTVLTRRCDESVNCDKQREDRGVTIDYKGLFGVYALVEELFLWLFLTKTRWVYTGMNNLDEVERHTTVTGLVIFESYGYDGVSDWRGDSLTSMDSRAGERDSRGGETKRNGWVDYRVMFVLEMFFECGKVEWERTFSTSTGHLVIVIILTSVVSLWSAELGGFSLAHTLLVSGGVCCDVERSRVGGVGECTAEGREDEQS
ncbi:hypothetical protein Tco_0974571 [Tanacetum coccineum]|uniref:Uncharacterized protein n=1 Tax=Tanacetum coccineum TaxID=301880 RepID=A0ABQ5EC01_9ASTR